MSKSETGEYRSLTGHNFVNKNTGKEVRVEPGGKIVDMNDVSIKYELEAGNIEPWESGHTENVRTDEQAAELVTVQGADEGSEEE